MFSTLSLLLVVVSSHAVGPNILPVPPRPLSGYQPIIKIPEPAKFQYMVSTDQHAKFNLLVDLPQAWVGSSATVSVTPKLHGVPNSISLSGTSGLLAFKAPSDSGYYTFTVSVVTTEASKSLDSKTQTTTFILEVRNSTGIPSTANDN